MNMDHETKDKLQKAFERSGVSNHGRQSVSGMLFLFELFRRGQGDAGARDCRSSIQ